MLALCIFLPACSPLDAIGYAADWLGTDLVRSHDETPWCAEGCEPEEAD
jgi:hypothetical protein